MEVESDQDFHGSSTGAQRARAIVATALAALVPTSVSATQNDEVE